jgi:hypothetical protein
MQIEGACTAEVVKLMEYVERKEDPLIYIVRTHRHDTNQTLLQTIKNFKKPFQNQTKQMENITVLWNEGV